MTDTNHRAEPPYEAGPTLSGAKLPSHAVVNWQESPLHFNVLTETASLVADLEQEARLRGRAEARCRNAEARANFYTVAFWIVLAWATVEAFWLMGWR